MRTLRERIEALPVYYPWDGEEGGMVRIIDVLAALSDPGQVEGEPFRRASISAELVAALGDRVDWGRPDAAGVYHPTAREECRGKSDNRWQCAVHEGGYFGLAGGPHCSLAPKADPHA